MQFQKDLEKAKAEAPNEDAANAVQAVIDQHCVIEEVEPQAASGGNGPPPKPPGI